MPLLMAKTSYWCFYSYFLIEYMKFDWTFCISHIHFLGIVVVFGELLVWVLYLSKSFTLILLHIVPLYLIVFMPKRKAYLVLTPYVQRSQHLNHWHKDLWFFSCVGDGFIWAKHTFYPKFTRNFQPILWFLSAVLFLSFPHFIITLL